MFVCGSCQGRSKSGEPSHNIVTKKRKVLYGLYDKNQNQLGKKLGWEAIQELQVCGQCNTCYLQTEKGE